MNQVRYLFLCVLLSVAFVLPVYASEGMSNEDASGKIQSSYQKYSIKKDMAFLSVMGSRPDYKKLSGFQKAVLYNAQGAKVKEINFSKSDSVYSLDKMIQENKNKGPLLIRMIR